MSSKLSDTKIENIIYNPNNAFTLYLCLCRIPGRKIINYDDIKNKLLWNTRSRSGEFNMVDDQLIDISYQQFERIAGSLFYYIKVVNTPYRHLICLQESQIDLNFTKDLNILAEFGKRFGDDPNKIKFSSQYFKIFDKNNFKMTPLHNLDITQAIVPPPLNSL